MIDLRLGGKNGDKRRRIKINGSHYNLLHRGPDEQP